MCDLFDVMWRDYCAINPQADEITQLLSQRGDTVVNDHIALRTINEAHCDIDAVAQAFLAEGYTYADTEYVFTEKHLRARHLYKENQPLVFISSLQLSELSDDSAQILKNMVAGHVPDLLTAAQRLWTCNIAQYQLLLTESAYAAWFAAFAWRANHFTINVNALSSFAHFEDFTQYLQAAGYVLNTSGGIIKGSVAQGLRQASTMAAQQDVQFTDGTLSVPTCYVEFAERFLVDGKLFQGFIASSADKIFESTDEH